MFPVSVTTESKSMKVLIETSFEWEAKGMLSWWKYKSTCENIREYLQAKIDEGNLSDDVQRELQTVQSFLYAYEDQE